MTRVRLENISRLFGQTIALDNINLQIESGELFFLLGPSGCGKSTLLRIIAGLLEPSSGKIFFNDRDVTNLATDKRNAVMCFQSYALWPHMTVRENVRFGLRVRKLPRSEQEKRVGDVLTMVQMNELAGRKPNQLSGGQQQRVALARALAVQPDCLLLDEPLSNLDARLRQEMRGEIRRICKSAGFTTIYVTHDQKEALSVADRIAVMQSGRLAQVGSPVDLYYRPASSFVAGFIGETNLLQGSVIGIAGDTIRVRTEAGEILARRNGQLPTQAVKMSIRPEKIHAARRDAALAVGINQLRGKVMESTFLGESSEHVVAVLQQRLKMVSTPPMMNPPDEIVVEFDPADVVLLAE
jgi:iron(III) transport system ATP-binding protein